MYQDPTDNGLAGSESDQQQQGNEDEQNVQATFANMEYHNQGFRNQGLRDLDWLDQYLQSLGLQSLDLKDLPISDRGGDSEDSASLSTAAQQRVIDLTNETDDDGDPTSPDVQQPSSATLDDLTGSSSGASSRPSQPGGQMRQTANAPETVRNQYNPDMLFHSAGTGNMDGPSPSNSILLTSGTSQANRSPVVQRDFTSGSLLPVSGAEQSPWHSQDAHSNPQQSQLGNLGFGDIQPPTAEGGIGTGQIEGSGQTVYSQPYHQRLLLGNSTSRLPPSNQTASGTAYTGLHQLFLGHSPESRTCVTCNAVFKTRLELSVHRIAYFCGSCHPNPHTELRSCCWCGTPIAGNNTLLNHQSSHFRPPSA